MYERYFDEVDRLLRLVREANRDSIPAAASVIADTVAANGIVRAFGSGHSQILARELADRAGGLAGIEVIIDPSEGKAETIEGYAATLLYDRELQPPDCLIVISTSGRNAAPIEMALIGRDRGVPVIGVTSVAFSLGVSSRHSSRRRLLEVVDIILDSCGAVGDAAVDVEGVPTNVGPTSTAIGAALLNAVFVEAIADLVRRGVEPPVLMSQNVDGTSDYNTSVSARYRGRIRIGG